MYVHSGNNEKKVKQTLVKRLREHLVFSLSVMTMHGLIHIVRYRRMLFERVVWLGIVIAAGTAAGLQAQQIWDRYQTNPVVTIVEKDFVHWKVPFPAITICQKGTSKLNNLVNNYYNYETLKKYADNPELELFPPSMYLEIAKNITLTIKPDNVGARKLKTQHPLAVIRPFHTILTERGVCSTYNSEVGFYFDWNKSNRTDNITTDFKNILKTYTMQVLTFATEDIIVPYELFIHSTNEIIDVTSRPIATPETQTVSSISIDVTNVASDKNLKWLTPQQRKCRFLYESDILPHSQIYSYNLCIRECRIKVCLEKCNCIPYYYGEYDNTKICSLADLYCLSKWKDELIDVIDSKQCNCLPNCEFQTVLPEKVVITPWFLSSSIHIEYFSFPKIRYKRFQIFTKTDALVQIGGLFGLFLGCSILSFIELPYFLLIRLYWGVFGRRPIKASL